MWPRVMNESDTIFENCVNGYNVIDITHYSCTPERVGLHDILTRGDWQEEACETRKKAENNS